MIFLVKKNVPCLSGYGLYSIDMPECKIIESEKAISYERFLYCLLKYFSVSPHYSFCQSLSFWGGIVSG